MFLRSTSFIEQSEQEKCEAFSYQQFSDRKTCIALSEWRLCSDATCGRISVNSIKLTILIILN